MSDPRDELPDVPALRTHEPPPGGLAMLRERIAAQPRRRWSLVAAPAALVLAAIVVLALVRRPPVATPALAPVAVVPVATLAPVPVPPPPPVRDVHVASDVQFYWVSSAQRTPEPVAERPQTISIDEVPLVASVEP